MEILARAVGRRKEAVAQVQLVQGNGQFLINNKPAEAYLQNNSCSLISVKAPLEATLSLFSNNPLVPASQNPTLELKDLPLSTQQSDGGPEVAPSKTTGVEKMATLANSAKTERRTVTLTKSLQNSVLKSDNGQQSSSDSEEEEGVLNWGPGKEGEIDIIVKVRGGGLIGQAEAIKLGVARAFCILENVYGGALLRKILKTKGFLTQDSRVKERKKYGLKKARKASQYHKR